jgi:hypothetical protein
MTWLPAPIVKSMSVAVGDIEMMWVGFAVSVVPSTVTGYETLSTVGADEFEAVGCDPPEPQPASARAASAKVASAAAD